MPLVTSAAIAGAALGNGGIIGGLIAGTAAAGIGASVGYDPISMYESAAHMMDGPDIPDAPTPDAPVEAGSEGIRSGEMQRQAKRRALGQTYLTRGQDRATGATLGGTAETLG